MKDDYFNASRNIDRKYITIEGARENNLKNINVKIPRDKFVVVTGLSGSGKSSLAFDTIYAEGQRRYMESLSSYARQFLGQAEKPDVDKIEGLSPAISIDQKSTNRNPRSTVGTVTEIYDYFRLLYARVGIPHCPNCGKVISRQTVDQMVDEIMKLPERTKFMVLAPVVRGRKGEHVKLLEKAKKSGFVRVVVDGSMYELSEEIKLDKNKKHSIDIVVDRLVVRQDVERRLTDSIETALQLAEGLMKIEVIGERDENGVQKENAVINFSDSFSCPDCGISIDEIEPRSFSFNNPFGACPTCAGLGFKMEFDPDLMIPDQSLSINDGAIVVLGWQSCNDGKSYSNAILKALGKEYGFSLDTPFQDYPQDIKDLLLYGKNSRPVKVYYKGQRGEGVYDITFEGLLKSVARRYRETSAESTKAEYETFMTITPCEVCGGKRLKPTALAVTVGDKNIAELTELPITELAKFMKELELTDRQKMIGAAILKEIRSRLHFLIDVGLDYLCLSRGTSTLSGGEAQRIRLATQIGSGLVGVAYILDEPSIGLHQRDNDKLIAALKNLRDLGNTLIVVEHDEDTMRAADHIIDIGPGAGANGGYVVAEGTAEDIMKCENSITGDYLSGRKKIEVPDVRRKPTGWLTVKNAYENNLKHIDVDIPLGIMTCVTGVSGSGKSSLVNEILYKKLARRLNKSRIKAGKHDHIIGYDALDKIINIDQSPIGRTPRSNPATYTGTFDLIRDLFAGTKDAKARGYGKGRFSFNVSGGRCEACRGDGIIKIEMHFLPDIYVPCEVCGGKRYNRETLEVKYKGKSINEVLDMTVDEACEFFANVPRILRKIETLRDVGLGYIRLGQPSTTLSGGEAQRIKLATELSRRGTGKTIYVLDEPTTGLHFADVHRLVDILRRLSEGGNTVVVIEHNLDVIKTADYIIDMGPEGGAGGGTVIARGTPEEVAKIPQSYTGQYLKRYLGM
ncbi:excinuclease ABC subunit UvrA [Coprococcus eutactus]|uniref:excinuclease ABC subunit UvrA n=1 Tax=Coprococcus eutactus TaxID=33043 RepID=UPI0005D26006|nr:excinuclease ABC subunit UvrA [Coprococcus eutactus]MBT9731990.1 excinuclease ABC subunit UvrA [Coprococcus eutactus]MBT9754001.1 excinuclease ABC subunit UvrA [Coprococcus eutactus]MCB6630133.1 excinuclease ABC subunit UvrA [Coprococcus eutactus]MCG4791290.1 excinuclease ABC subunit UvrA [Coprococcus eutactus]MCQ5120115.1 excinuclease ABC subunit UvrA [Coprococcus eutactus]